MRGVFAMMLYQRPEYVRQVLDHLSKVTGIGDCLLLPHVEPGNDEVRELVKGIKFADCRPTFNTSRLGVNANWRSAMHDAYQYTDFVMLVEDDILLAPDALTLFDAMNERFKNDQTVLSTSVFQRHLAMPPESDFYKFDLLCWYQCWASGLWRDRWLRIDSAMPRNTGPVFFDTWINEWRKPQKLFMALPCFSRAQNIGVESSVHLGPGGEAARKAVKEHPSKFWGLSPNVVNLLYPPKEPFVAADPLGVAWNKWLPS